MKWSVSCDRPDRSGRIGNRGGILDQPRGLQACGPCNSLWTLVLNVPVQSLLYVSSWLMDGTLQLPAPCITGSYYYHPTGSTTGDFG